MTITKQDNGKYLVDVRPAGRAGKRIRKLLPTKAEALAFERWTLATQHDREWLEKPADRRLVSDLVDLWLSTHGNTLADGKQRHKKMLTTCANLGNPRADQLTPALFAEYRAQRRAAGITANTLNHEAQYLSIVFNKLIELGLFHSKNPLAGLKLLKIPQATQGFLSREQINGVLEQLTGDNLLTARLCLMTGARWSEAAKLPRRQLQADRVHFTKTKTGKNRTIQISPEFAEQLHNRETESPLLFPDVDYCAVRAAIKRAAPNLPKGQATHVFRHSFASHFMANGGNILILQQILGHRRIQQTMVYAHFAPDHLIDAVTLNPLVNARI